MYGNLQGVLWNRVSFFFFSLMEQYGYARSFVYKRGFQVQGQTWKLKCWTLWGQYNGFCRGQARDSYCMDSGRPRDVGTDKDQILSFLKKRIVKPFKVKGLFASFYMIFLPNLHIISLELQSDRYSELQIWTTERSRSHRNPHCRKSWLPTHIVQNCWTGWQKPSKFCSGVLSLTWKHQVGIELRTCCLPVKLMDSWQVSSLL